uniref:B1168G10.13 protein n=1 Tax=Oryza sativa subsp. japonica TaxID=39947 RepID=Q5H9V7_ORYSJ|nr:B1168G10.13 [Oryza sativa Japonica Group]
MSSIQASGRSGSGRSGPVMDGRWQTHKGGGGDGSGEGGGGEVEVAVVVQMATERAAVIGDPGVVGVEVAGVVNPGVGEVRVREVGEVDGRTAERTSGGGGEEDVEGGRDGGGEVEAMTVERTVERARQ